jgi:hypothetical protein
MATLEQAWGRIAELWNYLADRPVQFVIVVVTIFVAALMLQTFVEKDER